MSELKRKLSESELKQFKEWISKLKDEELDDIETYYEYFKNNILQNNKNKTLLNFIKN